MIRSLVCALVLLAPAAEAAVVTERYAATFTGGAYEGVVASLDLIYDTADVGDAGPDTLALPDFDYRFVFDGTDAALDPGFVIDFTRDTAADAGFSTVAGSLNFMDDQLTAFSLDALSDFGARPLNEILWTEIELTAGGELFTEEGELVFAFETASTDFIGRSVIPLPASVWMVASGLGALALLGRRGARGSA